MTSATDPVAQAAAETLTRDDTTVIRIEPGDRILCQTVGDLSLETAVRLKEALADFFDVAADQVLIVDRVTVNIVKD